MDTHIFSATGPTSAPTRCFISSAALFVNVMARISNGLTPWSRMRWAMRCVSTRVLPEPAPATISRGPSRWVTASALDRVQPPEQGVVGGAHDRPPYKPPVTAFAAAYGSSKSHHQPSTS